MIGVAVIAPVPFVDHAVLAVGRDGHPGQPGHGLLGEDVAGPHRQARGPGPGHHLHRGNAVPAQVEERIVGPDPLDAQDLGIDAGQGLLDRGLRGAIAIGVGVFR